MNDLTLWYKQPANIWEKGVVLGNGILGAIVFGGVDVDRIQLNEETLWSGYKQDADNPECLANLDEMRTLIFAGKYSEAQELCNKYMVCKGKGSNSGSGFGTPYGSYETAGDLYIKTLSNKTFNDVKNYKRTLNLYDAVAATEYDDCKKTYFVSYNNNVAVTKIEGSNVSLKINFQRNSVNITSTNDTINVIGSMEDGKGISYATVVKVVATGGKTHNEDSAIIVNDATNVIIYTTITTTYAQKSDPLTVCNNTISKALNKGYDDLYKEHIQYFNSIMGRVEVDLNSDANLQKLPTDERLKQIKENKIDLGLIEIYFQFGRYLLISSSRGVLPANLQGIWTKDYATVWSADYHININIQMNYWPAYVTNLAELTEPFYRYIESLVEPGEITAKTMYNCKGWVAHTITNPWGFTSPGEHPSWGSFMCAGAWCCRHYWEHYLYTGDVEFLRKYYPVIKGSAEFFSDFLVRDPNTNYLVTVPSNSPENAYVDPKTGKGVAICAGPTLDNTILYDLFTLIEKCSKILNIDTEFAAEMISLREQLPPLRVGKYGQVMEWQEDFDEIEPGHRHMSNIYGLHPIDRITQSKTPELFEACKKSIERRLSHGGGHSGWSRAWVVNFYARLFDGENAFNNLNALLAKSTFDNLFDNHPPFQIDGNFGGTAGIAEMLLHSHEEYITILPAVPNAWKDGQFKGLVARGGFVISAKWSNNVTTECIINSLYGNLLKIKINGKLYEYNTKPNQEIIIK